MAGLSGLLFSWSSAKACTSVGHSHSWSVPVPTIRVCSQKCSRTAAPESTQLPCTLTMHPQLCHPPAQLCTSIVTPFREGSLHEQLVSDFTETSENKGKYYLEIMSRKSGTNLLCSIRMQPAEHLFSMQSGASPYTGALYWVSHNNLRVTYSELS